MYDVVDFVDFLKDLMFPASNVLGKVDRLGYPRCDGYNVEDFQVCAVCDEDNKGYIGDEICPRCGGYGESPIGLDNQNYLTEEENVRLINKEGEIKCLN